MNHPEKRIVDFIKEHHVLTLATCVENQPWCTNCFYVYLEVENCFVYTSDDETRHVKEVLVNTKVAASVVVETNVVGKIQGIQLTGTMVRPGNELDSKVKNAYLKKFPFAMLLKTSLWVLKPDFIKMTDNRLGFGKKLIWKA